MQPPDAASVRRRASPTRESRFSSSERRESSALRIPDRCDRTNGKAGWSRIRSASPLSCVSCSEMPISLPERAFVIRRRLSQNAHVAAISVRSSPRGSRSSSSCQHRWGRGGRSIRLARRRGRVHRPLGRRGSTFSGPDRKRRDRITGDGEDTLVNSGHRSTQ